MGAATSEAAEHREAGCALVLLQVLQLSSGAEAVKDIAQTNNGCPSSEVQRCRNSPSTKFCSANMFSNSFMAALSIREPFIRTASELRVPDVPARNSLPYYKSNIGSGDRT